MTIRNLEVLLAPRSVALIGATEREKSVGRVVFDNVRATFKGDIYPVNLKYDQLGGQQCYRHVADLPAAPDLAVIMTPAPTVPRLVEELGRSGCKAAVVLSAGFDRGVRQAMLEAARPHLLRIVGPNTIGILAPRVGLNASFAHLAPRRGRLGLISQSGAIVSSMIDWAVAEGLGFSQVFSLGDMADVDVGDCLDLLALDDQTEAILIYLEAITNPRKFMSAARAASRIKPVIALKPGRHAAAARAAATHTGALAGADDVVDAVLRRAGIIRVNDLEQLFDAAEVTGRYRPMRQARTAIVTNGGGAGVLAVDELLDRGAPLATLSTATIERLDAAMPAMWSRSNPVDIIGDAPPERYRAAVEAVAADEDVDAILVMNCPTGIADPLASAAAVASLTDNGQIKGKPVLTCWLGQEKAEPARALLQAAGLGSFDDPSRVAEALSLLSQWSRLRERLEGVPPSGAAGAIDVEGINKIIGTVAAEGRKLLTEAEAKAVLVHCGVGVPETVVCDTEDSVGRAAIRLLATHESVVVKMLSKSVSHKSDLGGVVLNLGTAEAAKLAAETIRTRFAEAHPGVPLDGFTVQPMVRPRDARELLAGITTDPIFGPVVVFGAGGTSVEVVADTAMGIVPLDSVLADDIIDRTRISRLLAGYRDVRPADRSGVVRTLVGLSELAVAVPAISAVDINPLVVSPDGAIALDARIEIDPSKAGVPGQNPALIIRPYPPASQSVVTVGDCEFIVRPIRPSDAHLYPEFLDRMDPEDMRRRFFIVGAAVTRQMLVRLTQLDYDREIALVALDDAGTLAGIVRYATDPDHRAGEYGVLVRSDLKGRGLGRKLMELIIAFARDEGLEELFGFVLPDNEPMLRICRDYGFSVQFIPGEGYFRTSLKI